MSMSFRFILVLAGLIAGGCATARSRPPVAATAPTASSVATTAPARAEAALTLDEIQPPVSLQAVVAAASQPAAGHAPIQAVTLYAQAVDALQTGRRFAAINLLEKAIALDPQSFELNYALGRAHLIGRTQDEQSIQALERAAALQPDHLDLQTDLGRQYLARGDQAKGMEHLRLAVQTTEYKNDDDSGAVTDLFLARALQQGGYDRAALEQYAALLRRAQGRSLSMRNDPQLAFLITDRLYVDIGDLYARNGQLEDALAAFEPAAKRDPSDFDLEARVVRTLTSLRRFDEASRRAAEGVVRFRAGKQSLELLREVHRAATGDAGASGAADALARMHAQRPGDNTVLFAMVELLREDGRWAEAEGALEMAAERAPDDFAVLRRRVQLRAQRDDVEGAARLLIQTLAARPDLAGETDALWEELISPARANHLRLARLREMPVTPVEAAAKSLCIAKVAAAFRRPALSSQALDDAVKQAPPFAPAFRERLADAWKRPEAGDGERTRLTERLISAAAADKSLAQELKGLALLYRKDNKAAVTALEGAIGAGGRSPTLLLAYAAALKAAGESAKSEQLLWKLLSDHPAFEEAYSALYAHYADAGSEAQQDRVLNTWLVAMPYSDAARLLQAARYFRAGNIEAAQQSIAKLLDDRSDDAGVLRTAYAVYSRVGKTDALLAKVEQHVRAEPGNVAALTALIDLYEEKGRAAEAPPLIDAARAALADEPDFLYQVASLYTRVAQRQTAEDLLRRILEIDPTHPPASNDLGYSWAERGENLPRAETLIRQAVAAEPGNLSFLDSLGWVLYKRGKFGESRPNLEKAAADVAQADPVVLDHLGDLLYRLGDRDAAGKQWEQADAKLKDAQPGRDDLKQLKTDLARKAKQLKAGEPVTVSPVVEESQQAKN